MAIQVRFNVWVEIEGAVALSLWRVALLEAVARTGSISAAAAERGVHFRVAWRKIKEMETRLGTRLVIGHAGGAGGGGVASVDTNSREGEVKTGAVLAGCWIVFWAGVPVDAQISTKDRLAAYERAIQELQAQVKELRQEVAELRAAQREREPSTTQPTRPTPSVSPRSPAQVFGYLQSQFEMGPGKGTSRFLARRSRVGVRGQLEGEFSYELQVDAAANTGVLRNAFIDYGGWKGGSGLPVLRFGQFKLPYSLEAIESSTTLPLIERALVVEQLAVNHDRDVGLALQTRPDPRRPYAYQLSITNGAGRNQFASTGTKLLAGRVQVNTPQDRPLLGGTVALGFSTRQGHTENLNRPAGDRAEDERYGADVDYAARRLRLRGEYLWGRDDARKPRGYYGLGVYRLQPSLELVGRYEGFTSDTGGRDSTHRTTLGLNYFFSRNTKAMLNYEFLNGRPPGDLHSGLRLRLQAVFP